MIGKIRTYGIGLQSSYDVELAKRLTIFTGDNGLGKTFVLDLVWWCLTQSWRRDFAFPNVENPPEKPLIEGFLDNNIGAQLFSEQTIPDFKYEYSYEHQRWIPKKQPEAKSLVIYMSADSSISVWDPYRHTQPDGRPFWNAEEDKRNRATFFKSQDDVWYGLADDNKNIQCNGLIRDWISWQRNEAFLKTQGMFLSEFFALTKILELLSCPGEELKPGRPARPYINNALDYPTLETNHGLQPLHFASAGIKRILELTYIIVWSQHEHTMAALLSKREQLKEMTLLIDEIELHLFPKWQRIILPALIKVSEFLGLKTQILITTHSPLVMASTDEFFLEDRDKVMIFKSLAKSVRLEDFPWGLRGSSDNWLTSEIFDLLEPRSRSAERAIALAEALIEGSEDNSLADVENQLVATLPSEDKFWVTWARFKELRGMEDD